MNKKLVQKNGTAMIISFSLTYIPSCSFLFLSCLAPLAFKPLLFSLPQDLANNKIKSMEGLKELTKLRKLDLGANRIRIMDTNELSALSNLEELWIGKNKIETIEGLEKVRDVKFVYTVVQQGAKKKKNFCVFVFISLDDSLNSNFVDSLLLPLCFCDTPRHPPRGGKLQTHT